MPQCVDRGADLVARLRAYEGAGNRCDVDACVAMFAEDGVIDDRGIRIGGLDAIRAAHEYDRAVNARVAFDRFEMAGETVTCRFVYTKELDRILGLDGFHQTARFTFRDDLIREFAIVGADQAEIERHRRLKGPFFAWARRHQPELHAASRSFDHEGGTALRRLGEAWVEAGRPETGG
jgi:hypothetical protein